MILIPLALIFGSYLVFSIFLFFYPSVLHKRTRHDHLPFQEALSRRKVLRICHRGGPRHTTENTIEAFTKAEPYSDMFELDVCETKDGILVVHHDHNLERTCGVKQYIRDINLADLPAFKPEIELNFAPQGLKIKSNNQKIPTLEQVFQAFPTMPMNIELKTPSTASLKELVRLVKLHNRSKITVIGVRGHLQQQLRLLDLTGLRFFNDKEFYLLLAYYFIGLLPFIYLEEATLQVPLFTEEFYNWKRRESQNKIKTQLFFKAMRILNFIIRPLVAHLQRRGIMTFYWVCNTDGDFERAIQNGAHGIMTDDVLLLDRFLANRSGPSPDSPQQKKTV